MRRRGNKEVNIFNMSMLDVISGALAAFILLTILLMPYYKKETIDALKDLKKAQEQLSQTQEALALSQQQTVQQQKKTQQAEQKLAEANAELSKTFLVVYISWETANQDVDLYVTTPSGKTFSYANKLISGEAGRLSVDARRGPATEVWEVLDANPGIYTIQVKLHSRHKNNKTPTVIGNLSYRGGNKKLPSIRLPTKGQQVVMTKIKVHQDGNVTLL